MDRNGNDQENCASEPGKSDSEAGLHRDGVFERREFITRTVEVAASATIAAFLGGRSVHAQSPQGSNGSVVEKTQPSASVTRNKKFAEPPFRVGFRRILDPSQRKPEPWYINDHCFICDRAGVWHVFGITAPEPAQALNEKFLLHATAKDLYGPWTERAPVMHVDESLGETVVWAPHVVEHEGRYWMFYCAGGESHEKYRIHLATSADLFTWTRHPANPMLVDGFDARDPMVLRVDEQWILYYCATENPSGGNHIVAAVTSSDLIHWSERKVVFRSSSVGKMGGPTESPFVVAKDGKFYLFVCTNNPYSNTGVYVSDSPFSWSPDDLVLTYGAHASEVIRVSEKRWFTSAAGWGQGGLYLSELNWG